MSFKQCFVFSNNFLSPSFHLEHGAAREKLKGKNTRHGISDLRQKEKKTKES